MEDKVRALNVRMVIMDVDGTLTDGKILVMPDGEELKHYDVKDGTGILFAHLVGLKTGIITGKSSKALVKRAETLKINEVHQGILDKKKILFSILDKYNLTWEQIAYIGDDLGDLEVIKSVGLAGAVSDAHPEIIKHSHFVCCQPGGKGAVREFIEFIIDAQEKWPIIRSRYNELINNTKK
jgi:3-deoxy-D-manno-octulosonate 8-phosphate phosphatase (KDO 8-P phosphatase)